MRATTFYTYVYVTKADKQGHVQYIIKIPKPIAEVLNLQHKQLIKVTIEVVSEGVKR